MGDNRAGDGNELLLAARQFVGIVIGAIGQSNLGQPFERQTTALGGRYAAPGAAARGRSRPASAARSTLPLALSGKRGTATNAVRIDAAAGPELEDGAPPTATQPEGPCATPRNVVPLGSGFVRRVKAAPSTVSAISP